MTLPLCTINDVEILKIGNHHSGLSGRVPITAEDIASIIAASGDSEVDAAPLKLGHVDPRFDGEPALGWVQNLRERGGVLVGDIVDAPAKMEAMIRGAFRRRSAEVAWNVKTPGGKSYTAALQGLALLGVQVPAVKGLADIASRYSGPMSETTDLVTLIDDDDSEKSDAIGVALKTLGAAEATLSLLSGNNVLLDGPMIETVHNDSTPPEDSMNDDEVRAALGLAADFPVSDQLRKIATDNKELADAQTKTAADAAAETDRIAAKAEADRVEAAALAADPTTLIDKAALAKLQADAALGVRAMETLDTQERERELAVALSGGKIAPASLDAYRNLWMKDKASTQALLAGLPTVFSTVSNFSGVTSTDSEGNTVDENGFTEKDWKQFDGFLTNYGGRS